MAKCSNCGKKIPDTVKFCTKCGAPVAQVAAPTVMPQPMTPSQEFAPPVVLADQNVPAPIAVAESDPYEATVAVTPVGGAIPFPAGFEPAPIASAPVEPAPVAPVAPAPAPMPVEPAPVEPTPVPVNEPAFAPVTPVAPMPVDSIPNTEAPAESRGFLGALGTVATDAPAVAEPEPMDPTGKKFFGAAPDDLSLDNSDDEPVKMSEPQTPEFMASAPASMDDADKTVNPFPPVVPAPVAEPVAVEEAPVEPAPVVEVAPVEPVVAEPMPVIEAAPIEPAPVVESAPVVETVEPIAIPEPIEAPAPIEVSAPVDAPAVSPMMMPMMAQMAAPISGEPAPDPIDVAPSIAPVPVTADAEYSEPTIGYNMSSSLKEESPALPAVEPVPFPAAPADPIVVPAGAPAPMVPPMPEAPAPMMAPIAPAPVAPVDAMPMAPIAPAPATPAPIAPATPAAPAPKAKKEKTPKEPKEKKGGAGKVAILIGAIVLALALIGVGIYFIVMPWLNGDKDSSNTDEIVTMIDDFKDSKKAKAKDFEKIYDSIMEEAEDADDDYKEELCDCLRDALAAAEDKLGDDGFVSAYELATSDDAKKALGKKNIKAIEKEFKDAYENAKVVEEIDD